MWASDDPCRKLGGRSRIQGAKGSAHSSSRLATGVEALFDSHAAKSRDVTLQRRTISMESHNPVSTTHLVLYGKSFVVGELSS